MDLAKLEKMKVVDLRNELQSRGLDAKGVKAVLIERLRAYLEGGDGGGACPGTPGTPSRRSRRTRSMTRSPTPSPVKKTDPVLEPLVEEEIARAELSPEMSEEPLDEVGRERIAEEEEDDEEEDEDEVEEDDRLIDNKEPEIDEQPEVENEAEIDEQIEEEEEEQAELEEETEMVENDHDEDQQAEADQPANETVEGEKVEEEEDQAEFEDNAEKHEAVTEKHEDTEKTEDKEVENTNKQLDAVEEDKSEQLNTVDEDKSEQLNAVDKGNEDKVENKAEKEIPQAMEIDEPAEKTSDKGKKPNTPKSSKEKRLSRKRSHSKARSRSLSERRSRSKSLSPSRSRSRSKSRSPKRRSGAGSQSSPRKGVEEEPIPEDEPTIEDKQFGLSWFDSDLHLRIDPVTFASAKPMSHEIFAIVWSGARTNYGVREGKVCFEVRLAEEMQMGRSHQFRDEPHVRGLRVGFSLPQSTLLLGEAENSFAYCESGRKASNSEFTNYGQPFKLDDVIGCYLDLESTPCTIKYTLNGTDLGTAFEFDKSILGETGALFPHILTKGYEFHVNFADNENLLGNVERPKRLRKKTKAPKEEEEKEELNDTNCDTWEVVDEAKDDDDDKETEKGDASGNAIVGDDVEMKPVTEETKVGTETEKEEEVEEKEKVEAKEEEKEKEEAKVNDEEKQLDGEKNEKSDDMKTEDDAKSSEEKSTEETTADKVSDDVIPNGEQKEKEEVVKKEKNEESGSSVAPAPKKRKLSNDRRRTLSEDEYEEVEPEVREPVVLLPGYELIALIPEEQYIAGPQRPESRKECEVILLVGLPGAGKTHWTLAHVKENPEKRYHVIGADALLAKMTIDGASRKTIHKGRWDKVYELCINSLSPLEEIAAKRRHNFILDQTNAYASAQRRKMKGFGDFKHIAVVCIPNEDELKRRNAEKTEKGNAFSIRDSTLNNLRANFTLPSLEFGWFDEIIFTDLSGDEAKEEVKRYNEKGKKALDSNPSTRDKRIRRDYRPRDDRRRYDDRRRDVRNDTRRFNNNDRRGGYSGSR